MAKKQKVEVVVKEVPKKKKTEETLEEDKPQEESEKTKENKTSWKRIGIGLGVVVIGNLYSYITAYSKGIFFDSNTIIGLLAIIIGLYIILK